MIAKAALLASLITCCTSTSAQASTAPAPPPHQAHISTEQMFRNYMQSGSIYYGPHHQPPTHIVMITKKPLLPAVENEAPIFAGLQPPSTP